MKTSVVIFIVLIILLALAVYSNINLNSTLEEIKNKTKVVTDQISTQSKEVLASDLVSKLRDGIKKAQNGGQPVSAINVEFYQPTN